MRVAIVGTGYVGLVSGACLAEVGHDVVCVDIDQQKVDRINAGRTPIHEHGLSELLERNIGRRLTVTSSLASAFAGADLVLICVGTPFDGTRIDLGYVLSAARSIGELIGRTDRYVVVGIKSTVVPGTTIGPIRDAIEHASGKRAGVGFGLGMNPEFLSEGVAVREFMFPDRIVVGGIDEKSTDVLARLYDSFTNVPIIRTNPSTAEMIKYASNSLLATMISFANEIAGFCEALDGVDVADVFRGVHHMKHLVHEYEDGKRNFASATGFLWPGCGFGGSCFPKDVKALVAQSNEYNAPARLLQAVLDVNARQPERLIQHLLTRLPDLEGRVITVLGLAFKPDTDDVRESPALPIVAGLVSRGARVVCHDPIAAENARSALEDRGVALGNVVFEDDLEDAIACCDAVLLVTKWAEYAGLPELLRKANCAPLVVDGRRFIEKDAHDPYCGIGIKPGAIIRGVVGSSLFALGVLGAIGENGARCLHETEGEAKAMHRSTFCSPRARPGSRKARG
jgi:UDPglucose 6-dehydrogenase